MMEEVLVTEAIAMSERRLQDAITQMARETDWYVYHTHIAKRGAEGYPDLTMANGRLMRHLWVELKREMKERRRPTITSTQVDVLNILSGVHQEVYLWLPRDWMSGAIATALTVPRPLADRAVCDTLWSYRCDRLEELDVRVIG